MQEMAPASIGQDPMSSRRDEFESISRSAVPHTRKGKHREIVANIIQQVQDLHSKKALKIPLSALGPAKIEHIRAALSRASAQAKLELSTSADDQFFYVWRQD